MEGVSHFLVFTLMRTKILMDQPNFKPSKKIRSKLTHHHATFQTNHSVNSVTVSTISISRASH